VFVVKRRDRWGNWYGFVRFIGVQDAHSLEKRLDDIWTGTTKMRVNIPKYIK